MIIYQTDDKNATWPLKQAVQSGNLGGMKVDPKSLSISEGTGDLLKYMLLSLSKFMCVNCQKIIDFSYHSDLLIRKMKLFECNSK